MFFAPAVINGSEVRAGDRFTDLDPATGQPLAEVLRGTAGDVDAAVGAARASADGWRRTSAADRAEALRGFAALIRRDGEKLAELESRDVGKPLRQARADAAVCARYFDFYASVLQAVHGETLPPIDGIFAFTRREPHGVTAHITPWNYPLQMAARTVAPALAAGNCAVLKPAEDAPLTSVELGRLALEAGLPAGALNVVPGFGTEAGAALAAHPGIDHISFTGSREAGGQVAAAAAVNIVPTVLELGGKSPHLLFADANLDLALPVIIRGITQNAGQTCSAGSRLLVHRTIADRVTAEIRDQFAAMRLGPGIEDADIGPLISDKQRRTVTSLVRAGADEAELVTGGQAPHDPALSGGFFFEPTLFADVKPTAVIAQREIFGPVLTVTAFDDDDEALQIANSTDYGLVSAVWTQDITRAHRLARDLRSGQVFINTYGAGGGVELPFGGVRNSGFGREKGVEGLLGYYQTKTVAVGL